MHDSMDGDAKYLTDICHLLNLIPDNASYSNQVLNHPQTMTTLKILMFCFAWRYSTIDGISAELEDLAFSSQSALQKILGDLHCCSEMASTELVGYVIGFTNDTNWAGFRHLQTVVHEYRSACEGLYMISQFVVLKVLLLCTVRYPTRLRTEFDSNAIERNLT